MRVIKAIYQFLVGDMVILVGVLLLAAILALFRYVPELAALSVISGIILVVGILAVLLISLSRETRPR